ncbi:MAG: nickel-dependent hydrogenase large subunit [Alphaproteobacteria bacterium]|nr:nickel-dependent hydrogenase large subunit [Alphaproteobacteria bacterium]
MRGTAHGLALVSAAARRGTHCGPDADLLERIAARNRAEMSNDGDKFRKIGGGIALHAKLDLGARRVADVASMATMFRGYETLLSKRKLHEVGLISATASGICGGVHAATSAQCLEMALGIKPPPLGIVARNLLLACQYLNDNPMHLFILSGPDYSESAIRATNPEIWAKAERAPARRADVHGYATVGAIMSALDRPGGRLFTEALEKMRLARAAYALIGGKYPHSESIVPGGVALTLPVDRLDAFLAKLAPFDDYARRCARIWDDVFDFLYECDPRYRDLGRTDADLIDFGQWDHERHYDATYANCDAWGEARLSTPGAVIDGALVTTRLSRLNDGMEEFVERAFYQDWDGTRHPWNKAIHRSPDKPGAYSWAPALAWDRHSFEVGATARLYISALARKMPGSDFVHSTGASLVFGGLEWHVPKVWNAFERNRARAYAVAFNLAAVRECHARAKALIAGGETEMRVAFDLPGDGRRLGVGFGGAGRGMLAHWAVLDGAEIENYQIAIPSRINAAPRTPWGELGPMEQAVMNTAIVESNFTGPEDFCGIDIVRAIQSFDPCMPCKAELSFKGALFTSAKEVTSDGLI